MPWAGSGRKGGGGGGVERWRRRTAGGEPPTFWFAGGERNDKPANRQFCGVLGLQQVTD